MQARYWQWLALGGYLGTFALLVLWYAWLSPSTHFPISLVLIALCTPLLFPLRGMLHGRPYTYGWSLFLALGYFTHGVVEAFSTPADRWFGLLEVVLTIAWFVGGILFIRAGKR